MRGWGTDKTGTHIQNVFWSIGRWLYRSFVAWKFSRQPFMRPTETGGHRIWAISSGQPEQEEDCVWYAKCCGLGSRRSRCSKLLLFSIDLHDNLSIASYLVSHLCLVHNHTQSVFSSRPIPHSQRRSGIYFDGTSERMAEIIMWRKPQIKNRKCKFQKEAIKGRERQQLQWLKNRGIFLWIDCRYVLFNICVLQK